MSATYRLPAASTATPCGCEKVAAPPVPLAEPATPGWPAIVATMYGVYTRRIALLLVAVPALLVATAA